MRVLVPREKFKLVFYTIFTLCPYLGLYVIFGYGFGFGSELLTGPTFGLYLLFCMFIAPILMVLIAVNSYDGIKANRIYRVPFIASILCVSFHIVSIWSLIYYLITSDGPLFNAG